MFPFGSHPLGVCEQHHGTHGPPPSSPSPLGVPCPPRAVLRSGLGLGVGGMRAGGNPPAKRDLPSCSLSKCHPAKLVVQHCHLVVLPLPPSAPKPRNSPHLSWSSPSPGHRGPRSINPAAPFRPSPSVILKDLPLGLGLSLRAPWSFQGPQRCPSLTFSGLPLWLSW